jgi:HK97 gp10 family phage protein
MARMLTPSNLRAVRFNLSGFDEYLARIQQVGNNIEEIVKEAIVASSEPIRQDIETWADKHEYTGAVKESVSVSDVIQDGFKFSVDIGIDGNINPFGWHAVFTEYGTPTQPADPGIRPAFDNNKSKVKRIQKEVLARGGVPV